MLNDIKSNFKKHLLIRVVKIEEINIKSSNNLFFSGKYLLSHHPIKKKDDLAITLVN